MQQGGLKMTTKRNRTNSSQLCLQALLVGVLPDFLPSGRYANSFYMVVSLTHTLAATNSSVNFFFYCALGSKYRASLQSLFRQRKTQSMNSATRASESRTVTDVDTPEPWINQERVAVSRDVYVLPVMLSAAVLYQYLWFRVCVVVDIVRQGNNSVNVSHVLWMFRYNYFCSA